MSPALKTYSVTFQDTLRIRVEVLAYSAKDAEHAASQQWSSDLWDRVDLFLADTPSEILESCNRDFFEVEEDGLADNSTNESTPS